MCLGIPGRIVDIADAGRLLMIVEISGVRRAVNVACILDDQPIERLLGSWTLVHAGFAMSRIDDDEAQATLALLQELGETQATLDAMHESERALGERP